MINFKIDNFNKTDYKNATTLISNSKFLHGGGVIGELVKSEIKKLINFKKLYLTTSGTSSIELALMSIGLQKGDEVIVPSFAFPSCATSIIRSGGVPVFCSINNDLNLSLDSVKRMISKKTKAVVALHYAGKPCDLDSLRDICFKNNLILIEDAAQAFNSIYKNKKIGLVSTFVCFSFHDTKNISCGEGGALIVNDKKYFDIIDSIYEKGTNRLKFVKKLVNKYRWVSNGGSFILSEINSAYLLQQLQKAKKITKKRQLSSKIYINFFYKYSKQLHIDNYLNDYKQANGHIYWIIFKNEKFKINFSNKLKKKVETLTHYEPLHSSPYGKKFRCDAKNMLFVEKTAKTILRLPNHDSKTAKKVCEFIFLNLVK